MLGSVGTYLCARSQSRRGGGQPAIGSRLCNSWASRLPRHRRKSEPWREHSDRRKGDSAAAIVLAFRACSRLNGFARNAEARGNRARAAPPPDRIALAMGGFSLN
jgi:hypothetical protein